MASPWSIFVSIVALFNPSWATPLVNTSAIIETLAVDFYKAKCPNVEKIASDIMKKRVQTNPGYIPGVMRLHFHDCFITGCDASILLSSEKYNSYNPELAHPANGNSLRGLEVINEIKTEVEKQCPGVVSCADILAYAARESIVLAGNPHYAIPAGRRDGTTIDGNFATDLPKPSFGVDLLSQMYAVKGLTVEDLVTLEGSHSIGRSRCSGTILDKRFPNNVTESEKIFDQVFGKAAENKYCPSSQNLSFVTTFVPLNPETLDSAWGVKFYDNIMKGKSVLPSDLAMAVNVNTKDIVKRYAADAALWKKKFNDAMIKLGKMNVLTGTQGEIRKDCRLINSVNMPVAQ